MEKKVDDVLNKYRGKIESQMENYSPTSEGYSKEYQKFKDEMSPDLSRYERWATTMGSWIKLKPSKKDEDKVQKHLDIAHLNIEPWQALTLGVMSFIFIFMIGLVISVIAMFLLPSEGLSNTFSNFPKLFFFLSTILSLAVFYFVNGYPQRLANIWRLKASSQMVPAILYVVVYMRHTPNLEKAISFAADHLEYPLSLDFKKVFYNVEVGKFSTIKESLDNYLETWRDYSVEFIEAFHLIESSLFEQDNARRITVLEKSLQVVLDGVYDKMLKFTHNVKSPLTNVYMLGVVLPTLGLALLPLASAMIGDAFRWYHVFLMFNLIIPFFVFYLVDQILLLRPGGHGETTLLERNPLYPKYISKRPYVISFLIALPFFIIGLLPLIFQFTPLPGWIGLQTDYSFAQLGFEFLGNEMFFDFKDSQAMGGVVGPFGVVALLMSMAIPFGLALFFSIAANMRTKEIIKERNNTRQLEREFNTSLFQIGNRLGNGVPPELIFGKIAQSSKGLMTEDFFRRVNYNIRQMGMSVEKAIFDPTRGAISFYPSDLIATSMRVLIESSKKGSRVAAISLMSISEYVKNIQKITTRLRDMLAEIISDMKSNMTFLAPLLSGIVIGLAGMITTILNKMNIDSIGGDGGNLGGFVASDLLNIFSVEKVVPPYYLQIIVGVYLVQIIFILTGALVTIDSGEDKLEKTHKTGKNLARGIFLYVITASVAIIGLFLLSAIVLGSL